MNHYETIRTLSRVYKKSIREISRETGHHRNTIKKALAGEAPKYTRKSIPKSNLMEPYTPLLESWLHEDQQSHRKQRHTAQRIFDRLVDEYGFTGSASRVRSWVAEKKKELGYFYSEPMVPLVPTQGKEAEVDWGDVKINLKGVPTTVKLFVMRSRYSGKIFSRVYPSEKQVLFFDAHIHAFESYGGIYRTLVYDNLKTAVKKVLKGSSREEQASFVQFRSYYNFESRFCSPGKGHEKGGVEGGVGYVRNNCMVPIPTVNSLEELNHELLEWCKKHSARKLTQKTKTQKIEEGFQEEKTLLIALPDCPYDNKQITRSKVRSYQVITLQRNFYSVPSEYCSCEVDVHLSCDEVTIFYRNKKIARHPRSYSQEEWILDPVHYLKTLERKVGAFEEALPILQWKVSWPCIYEIFLNQLQSRKGKRTGTQELIRILRLLEKYEEDELVTAMELARDCHLFDEESVKHLLDKRWGHSMNPPSLDPLTIPGVTDLSMEETDLSQYNSLLN